MRWAFLFTACLVSVNGHALEFEKRGNTEIISVTSHRVDLDLKVLFAARAQRSVEFMLFSAAADETGLPFLQAIRSAQLARNIQVKGMYDRAISATLEGDKWNYVKAMLTDPGLECRGEIFCAHPIEKLSSGVSLSDYIHGKVIIIDRGLPSEVIFWGGRGLTNKSAGHIDSGFLMRRIDPHLPYAGDDLKSVFDSVWNSLRKMAERSVIKIPFQVDSRRLKFAKPVEKGFSESTAERAELAEILNHLETPASRLETGTLKPFVFHPKSVQVLSNDLYAKLLEGKDLRAAFESDNHAKIISSLKEFSGTMILTAYSVSPDAPLHNAIVDFVKRGNNVEFYTNGEEAYRSIGAIQGFPAYYTYEQVSKIMEEARGPGSGKIDFYILDPKKAQAKGLATYVHRKNITYLDSKGVPIFSDDGSDNWTYSAAKKNDEILIRTEDERFARRNFEQILSERSAYIHLDHREIRTRYAKRPFWYGCIRSFIRTNF